MPQPTYRKGKSRNHHNKDKSTKKRRVIDKPVGKLKEIKFDAASREEYLTGSHKRKNERRAIAHFYKKQKDRMEQLEKRRKKRETEKAERDKMWHQYRVLKGEESPDEDEDEHQDNIREEEKQDDEDDFGFAEPPTKKMRYTEEESSDEEEGDADSNSDDDEEQNVADDTEQQQQLPEKDPVKVVNYDNKKTQGKVTVTVQPFKVTKTAREALLEEISDEDVKEESDESKQAQSTGPQKRKPTEKDLKDALQELNEIKNKSRKNKGRIATKSAKRWVKVDKHKKELEKKKRKR